MIARAVAPGALFGITLLTGCTHLGERTGAGVADTTARLSRSAPVASPVAQSSMTRVPSKLRRCASAKNDSVSVAGTDSLNALFALLVESSPSSEDSLSTAHLPPDQLMSFVGDSGLVFVDSSGAAPPVESKAVRHYTRTAVAEQLASKRGPVWEALAVAAWGLAQPESEAPSPFLCGMQDSVTLFVGDGSYRLVFTTQRGALRLTRIAYEPAEGN